MGHVSMLGSSPRTKQRQVLDGRQVECAHTDPTRAERDEAEMLAKEGDVLLSYMSLATESGPMLRGSEDA